jgi:iron complex transport system substrate-binding protein
VRAVAAALGVGERGEALAQTVDAEIAAAVEAAAQRTDRPRALVLYLRGTQTQLIFGAGTGVDVLLPAVGAQDVSAELGVVDTRPISAEALVQAAPDVLIVTTTGLASVGGLDELLAIPGVANTPAGRARRILAYEDQYLLGGGPRTGQLMSELIDDLHPTTP